MGKNKKYSYGVYYNVSGTSHRSYDGTYGYGDIPSKKEAKAHIKSQPQRQHFYIVRKNHVTNEEEVIK